MTLPATDSMTPFCRICHESSESLIQPCICTGTLAYVHPVCIQTWLKRRQSNSFRCEICGFHFVYRILIRSSFRFLFSWSSWREWIHIAYIVIVSRRLYALFRSLTQMLIPSTSASAGSSQYKRNSAMYPKNQPRTDVVRSRWRSWIPLFKKALFLTFLVTYLGLFVFFDLRFLIRRWLKWRRFTADIEVFDRRFPPITSDHVSGFTLDEF